MTLALSDDFNAPSFVFNGPKLVRLVKFDQAQKWLFPAKLYIVIFAKIKKIETALFFSSLLEELSY